MFPETRSLYFAPMEHQDSPTSEHPGARPIFEALLYPHRSLGRKGYAILLAGTAAIVFLYGMVFLVMGAWPIFGFCGTEWLLFVYLFRKHMQGDKRNERLRLYQDRLMVEVFTAKGERQLYRFQPYWLQVILDEPDEYESALYLRSHGKQLRIGSFLSPQERRDVAEELRAVLHRLRTA